jgi:proteasome lid subunit RPN8/RPN11
MRDSIAAATESAHPAEAGGYLICERRDGALHAVEDVPLENQAEQPRTRFVSDAEPDSTHRVFYHSHTSARAPSGLTRPDRKIPERLVLVVFAPHGEPFSYRLFERGVFRWHERPVVTDEAQTSTRLPRLV